MPACEEQGGQDWEFRAMQVNARSKLCAVGEDLKARQKKVFLKSESRQGEFSGFLDSGVQSSRNNP
ncbi:MAG: hypothetical protein DWQ01_04920 [Planctomycetota bacterium]|nr:MAG: hypothetical protein DWQ01_04920 [Planctomycetota bacterium]